MSKTLRKMLLGPLALLIGLASAMLIGSSPASASTCVMANATNPYTGHTFVTKYVNVLSAKDPDYGTPPNPTSDRGTCVVVWVIGPDASGNYNFVAAGQDVSDANPRSGWEADDGGYLQLWYRTPGSAPNDWHPWFNDINSADFNPNENCGTVGFKDPCYLGNNNQIGGGPGGGSLWVSLNETINGAPEGFAFKASVVMHTRRLTTGASWHFYYNNGNSNQLTWSIAR